MPSKLQKVLTRLGEDGPVSLAREAVWRMGKSGRLQEFEAEMQRMPDVRYRTIGYYRPALHRVTARDRESILHFSDCVLRGEFPLLGYGNPELGLPPDWNKDFVSGKNWPLGPSETLTVVCYDGSDVKAPWELSRLQFLPVLAKANSLTGEERYRAAARDLLADWIAKNPVGMGVNWTLAMEAALRGISMVLLLDLLEPLRADEQQWLAQVAQSLWQHLLFIEAHNEFSHLGRSNHFLSNIMGLTTLSAALDGPGMDHRFQRYAQAVQEEILHQTYADGGDFEASTGYHTLVSQMFLHSYIVQRAQGVTIAPQFRQRLQAMFTWLAAIAGYDGRVAHLGDCDDGRVELLQRDIDQASWPLSQRHSLRLASYLGLGSHVFQQNFGDDLGDAVWFGADAGQVVQRDSEWVAVLRDSGLAVARRGDSELLFSGMPNGIRGRGSHTHNDKLSFVLRLGAVELFCDSGTRFYTRDPAVRNRYRSAHAHNVLVMDDQEQNTIARANDQLFRIGNEAVISQIAAAVNGCEVSFTASHNGYERFGVRHSRTLRFAAQKLLIEDFVQGTGRHAIDLCFHLGPEWLPSSDQANGNAVACRISGPAQVSLHCQSDVALVVSMESSEISRAYGSWLPSKVIHIRGAADLPVCLTTSIGWSL